MGANDCETLGCGEEGTEKITCQSEEMHGGTLCSDGSSKCDESEGTKEEVCQSKEISASSSCYLGPSEDCSIAEESRNAMNAQIVRDLKEGIFCMGVIIIGVGAASGLLVAMRSLTADIVTTRQDIEKTVPLQWVRNLQNSHSCVERAMHHDCPVCFEYLFESTNDVSVLPCGHTIHVKCLKEMQQHLQYACPLCSKSVCDMSKVWEMMDVEVAATPIPEVYQNRMVSILCNDCGASSTVQFHVLAQKCLKCKSYNTRQM
ncbi:hypothetical protein QJS10_CPA07g00465 [Acorus calamus]|uniref:RING-type domain-containing protein n=1 Tax=Acorus calamus TaxID=4465 RepID=A0AAV9EI55_ACOCL|nr:hypothetical protein QJS10_CPA07g00465 [Acorus calamus]